MARRAGKPAVDEAILRGTTPRMVLRGIFVNQIDVRGADLRELTFEESALATAIVDDGTRVSTTFPTPGLIRRQNIATKRDDDEWDRRRQAPGSTRMAARGRRTGPRLPLAAGTAGCCGWWNGRAEARRSGFRRIRRRNSTGSSRIRSGRMYWSCPRHHQGGRPRPASDVYSAEYRTEEHPRQAVKTDSAK